MDKKLGPRVTLADIEAEIASEHFFTAYQGAVMATSGPVSGELSRLTFCVLVLHNGAKFVGINHGPVDPASFNPEMGRRYAREDAIAKLWEPLGFRMRDRMAAGMP